MVISAVTWQSQRRVDQHAKTCGLLLGLVELEIKMDGLFVSSRTGKPLCHGDIPYYDGGALTGQVY